MKRSSRNRLTPHSLPLFPGQTLFDRIARTVCLAGCLPRKELYESWEVARQIRRRFRGGRIVDLACGHGLLGQIMLLLDDTSPVCLAVDQNLPPSHIALHQELAASWPRLEGRIDFSEADVRDIPLTADDIVVSAHACGDLTDLILEQATAAGARLALLPCCHDLRSCDAGEFGGWLEPTLAIDVNRVVRLRNRGYTVATRTIPHDITPKNRLLIAAPPKEEK